MPYNLEFAKSKLNLISRGIERIGGVDITLMSSAELLQAAIEEEETAKACAPQDFETRSHFLTNAGKFFELALLKEVVEQG